MIATLSTIVYIASAEKQEIVGNKIMQKGQAISRINEEDHQIYNYTLFASMSDEADGYNETLQPFQTDSVYLLHGKFFANADGTLEVSVTSNKHLDIPEEEIPYSKPFVHLLGRTQHKPTAVKNNYQLGLQVRPYLSSKQCGTMSITLVHPLDGRFKNALEKTNQFASVHVMGALIVLGDKVYCDILEYQFVGTKTDESSTIIVPWKKNSAAETSKDGSSSRSKTGIEKRIASVHENLLQSPPQPTPSKRAQTTRSSKGKEKQTKIGDIARTLIEKRRKLDEQQASHDEHNEDEEASVMEIDNECNQTKDDDEVVDIDHEFPEPSGGRKSRQVRKTRKSKR
jgi:hypothetical protein